MSLRPVLWGQGMFLRPQHFQQQDAYHDARLQRALQLMQPFYQAEDPLVRENEGLGIGLTMAKQVAVAHGGGLQVENHPEGGTFAVLTIPTRPMARTLGTLKEIEEWQMQSPKY